jgi:transcriptional regulator with XRE-family HTH domain
MPATSKTWEAEGIRLKTWRLSRGISQETLGRYLGDAKKQQVCAWEKGHERVPDRHRDTLKAKFGLWLDYNGFRRCDFKAAWFPVFRPSSRAPADLARKVLTLAQGGHRWRFPIRAAVRRSWAAGNSATEAALALRRALGCGLLAPLPDITVALQRSGIPIIQHKEGVLADRLVAISSLGTVRIAGNFAPCESAELIVKRRVALLTVLALLEIQTLESISENDAPKLAEQIAANALLPDAALKDLTPRSPPEAFRVAAGFYGAPLGMLTLRMRDRLNYGEAPKIANDTHLSFQRESEVISYP